MVLVKMNELDDAHPGTDCAFQFRAQINIFIEYGCDHKVAHFILFSFKLLFCIWNKARQCSNRFVCFVLYLCRRSFSHLLTIHTHTHK